MIISRRFWFLSVAAAVLITGQVRPARAEEVSAPVSIHLEVEGPDSTIFDSEVTVPPCATQNSANSTVNGFCAFDAANLPAVASWSDYGALVNSIGGVSGDASNFWLWFINGEPAEVGIDSYILKPNDRVLWFLGRQPLKVSFSTLTPKVNSTSTVSVFGFDPAGFNFKPVAGAEISGTSTLLSPLKV